MFALASLAPAQPSHTLGGFKRGTLPNLSPVVAPAARCIACRDDLLAFGHDRTYPDAQVSLVRLDAKGIPATYATSWKLPCPGPLLKDGNYTLSVAFHPKLPLLYVWQDIGRPYTNPINPQPPEMQQFDHLLIYNVAKDKAELVTALCRGYDHYLFGQQGGSLGFDPSARFLYVPNMRDPKNPGSLHFGRFPLDADGLPDVLADADKKLPTDGRVKKLAERSAAGTLVPTQTPTEYEQVFAHTGFGCGSTFRFPTPEAVLSSSSRGILVWRPEDKTCAVSSLGLKSCIHALLEMHPTLPVVFATSFNTDSLFRVDHAEGYPTLLPMQYILPEKKLWTAPVLFAKGKKMAVGSTYALFVLDLDDRGQVQPEVAEVRVFNPQVRALAYSERHDRIYLSVEVSK